VRAGLELRELDASGFLANLDACTSVYASAMSPPGYQLPGRHAIMERHAGYAAFRAIVAVQPATDGPAGHGLLVGFTYGFHGEGGQWWHDVVSQAVANARGHGAADDWLADSFEIAEVHVLPRYQGQGTGLAMMLRLAGGRPERTAVLSTMDAETRARRLYRGLGFTDVLAGFVFAGEDAPYAIMGAPLPLREASPRPPRPERPSRS
jgi:ribosomal protein S18 acetylase RimI-like enzyme